MPVPLAAGLYGVLLGLGFTTFILTFAVWALAGISVALGDPRLGLADRPRASAPAARCPVIALAPSGGGAPARRDGRAAAHPARAAARSTPLALAVAAPPRCSPRPRSAAVSVAALGFADPTVDGATLALHRPGGAGELRGPAGVAALPGNHPAVGGGRPAWIDGATVVVVAGRRRDRRARRRRASRSRTTWVGVARRRGALRRAARPGRGRAAAGWSPARVGRPALSRQPARLRRRRPDRGVRPRHRRRARCCAARRARSCAARPCSATSSPTCARPTSASRC